MTGIVETVQQAIVVTDTSVLINFLRVDRMNLIAGHSHHFVVTGHVAEETSCRYPDRHQQFGKRVIRIQHFRESGPSYTWSSN